MNPPGICLEWVFKTFWIVLKFIKKNRGCGGYIQRDKLGTSVLYQLEARKGPTFTSIAHHWKFQGSGVGDSYTLTRRMTWKLSMPQLVQKPWNHSAGEKTCQVFVSCAVLEGIFLCISKAIYFVSTAESMGVWWVVDDILKKSWRRWCYIQMKPLKNITKLFCEVFFGQDVYTKDVYIIRIIRWWVRVPVDGKSIGSLEIKSELCIFTF